MVLLVAPHADVWIEMALVMFSSILFYVAPRVGAWIEILIFPMV